MKVLFILPPLLKGFVDSREQENTHLSVGHFMVYRERNIDLGVGYLAAVLENEGHGVKVIDCDLEISSKNELMGRIRKESPDLVAISGATENRFETFTAAELSKGALPETPVVYGGIHATFTADDTLRNVDHIDYVMRGEGELPIVSLVNALETGKGLERVMSISYRSGGRIIHNPVEEQVTDLDSIPFPARHLFPMEKFDRASIERSVKVQKVTPFLVETDKTVTHMITSRGCPNRCVYCSNSAMRSQTRYRRAGNVVDEIEEVYNDFGVRDFSFADDTFTLNRKHVLGILKEMESRKMDINWRCNVRVNTVDRDILARMTRAGCGYVAFGAESGSESVLRSINKNISVDQVRRLTKNLHELGIVSRAFFMFGLPDETMEDAMKTMDLMRDIRPQLSDIWISFATLIFPGTPLERMAKEKGYLPRHFSWSTRYRNPVNLLGYETTTPILLQPQLGKRELERIQGMLIKNGLVKIKSR